MNDSDRIEQSRKEFQPYIIRYLLIAESPPNDPARFFYFKNVKTQDSLYIETMRAIYYLDDKNAEYFRKHKEPFLHKFMLDGFYLIDTVDEPLGGLSKQKKIKCISNNLVPLKDKLGKLVTKETKIILISAAVHEALYEELTCSDYDLINESMINFPGSGNQLIFREKIRKVLRINGWGTNADN